MRPGDQRLRGRWRRGNSFGAERNLGAWGSLGTFGPWKQAICSPGKGCIFRDWKIYWEKPKEFPLSLCRSERLLGKGSSFNAISGLGARGSLGTFGL